MRLLVAVQSATCRLTVVHCIYDRKNTHPVQTLLRIAAELEILTLRCTINGLSNIGLRLLLYYRLYKCTTNDCVTAVLLYSSLHDRHIIISYSYHVVLKLYKACITLTVVLYLHCRCCWSDKFRWFQPRRFDAVVISVYFRFCVTYTVLRCT